MADDAANPLGDEELRKEEKPILNSERAVELAAQLYGLQVLPESLKDLDSYDDRNFYFRASHIKPRPELAASADEHQAAEAGEGCYHYVLKVHNGVESLSPSFIECQNLAMDAVRKSEVWCPRALPALDGSAIAFAPSTLGNGKTREHAVRCLPYRPGKLLGHISPTATLLRELGVACAKVSAALVDFDHPSAHRIFIWDLAQTLSVRPLVKLMSEAERREIIGTVLDEFEAQVLPRAAELQQCVIHGDINDQNVLIGGEAASSYAILGVIDFGDMSYTWRVNEIAIAAAYAVIALHYDNEAPATPTDTLSEKETCVEMVGAYANEMSGRGLPLTEAEWQVLPTLIACRISVSLCVGAYSSSKDPTNEYLKLTLLPGLKALKGLRATPNDELLAAMKGGTARAKI